MARIPVIENQVSPSVGGSFNLPDIVARRTVAPPDQPFRSHPDYMGQALERFGGAVASLGGSLNTLAQRRQETADASWFSKARAQTALDWLEKESQLRNDAAATPVNPGAGLSAPTPDMGFTDKAAREFGTYRDGVLASAPSEAAKEAYTQWSDGFGAQVAGRAYEFEAASMFAQRSADLNEAFGHHVQTVFQSPDQYDVVLARAMDDLAGAQSWMTPEQEVEARTKIETALQLARAKKLATFDPLRFQEEVGLSRGPLSTTAAKIIGIESEGNARADNPRSSASGLGQFTDATWIETIRKHRPDLTNLPEKDILKLKTDPDLAKEMTLRHTEDNAAGLQAVGIDPSEANLYLAHFAGLEGAKAVLAAPASASVVDVLGAAAVRANPFLQGMTVADLKAWAAKKMGSAEPASLGDFTTNPRYSRLSPDQIFALSHDADSAILGQHNAAVEQEKGIFQAKFNGLMTAIFDGNAGLADIQQARADGWLADYDDIKKATDAVTSRDKDAVNTARAVARYTDPSTRLNSFVEDDKKDIDLAYQAFGGATNLTRGDSVSVGRLQSFADKTDSIPDSAVDALKAGMVSRDVNERMETFKVMSGLYRQYPAAASRAFSEQDIARVQDYEALAPTTPPAELADRLDANMDPQKRKFMQDMREEGTKLASDIPTSEILDAFDEWWSSEPGAPLDPLGQVALRADFDRIFAERYAVSGDADLAKKQALERLTTKWGPTEVGDTSRIVAYPPERYYPALDGDHDWMADQVAETVQAQFPDAQSWSVINVPETEAAVRAGSPPLYQIGVLDADGSFHLLGENFGAGLSAPDASRPGGPALFGFDAEGERLARRAGHAGFTAKRRDELKLENAPVPARPMDTDLQWRLLNGQ